MGCRNLTFPGPPVPVPTSPVSSAPAWCRLRTTVTGTSAHDTIDCTDASPGKWILGLDGNDTITGTAFNDTIIGGNGNDTSLVAPETTTRRQCRQRHGHRSAGDDTLVGGTGNDTLSGGVGNDTIIALPATPGPTRSTATPVTTPEWSHGGR